MRQFRYGLRLAGAATSVRFGTPAGETDLDSGTTPWLRQLGTNGYPLGEVPDEGHAPGWVTVTSGGHAVTLSTKWCGETAPRALGHDAGDRALCLDLRPEVADESGYPLAAGRVKTYEFMLGVNTPGPELSALARAELHAYPDSEYVTSSGATHRFVPVTDPGFPSYATCIANTHRRAAAVRLYGDMDFGDQIGWNENERWNGYHGVTHEWFTFYLASGEPELFRIAEQETWHSLDVDTQQWGFQPGCREAEYARKHDHVCPLPYQGGIKVWVLGEVDYYLLTGRRRVLESLERTGQFLLDSGGVVNNVFTNERASSLPFLHLAHV